MLGGATVEADAGVCLSWGSKKGGRRTAVSLRFLVCTCVPSSENKNVAISVEKYKVLRTAYSLDRSNEPLRQDT